MPAAIENRKSKKSKKNSKKCDTKDKNIEKDLNNNKKNMETTSVQDYLSIQSNSTASLNNVNNSCSSTSSTITSPEISMANNALLPIKCKVTSKSNIRFHQLFPSISLDEFVIATYSCAYVKSLNLYQGVMFLTNNYICFYSKILNHENILILKLTHVNSIVKTMHALIFPTAIRIQTKNSTYSFTSFRSRGNTLDHLHDLLQKSRQRQVDQMNNGLSESSNLNTSSLNGEKNPDEINKIEEYKKKLDETTSINRTISESNFSDDSSPKPVKCAKKKPTRVVKKTDSTHFTSPHIPKQQANNLSYVLDFKNNTVIVSLKHKKTLIQRVKILLSLLIPGFFDISRIDALLPICFLMSILLLLNAFVLLSKVNQVDDIFNQLLIKNEFLNDT